MCIMEVRADQRSTTIAQALAHNVCTSKGDLEMFRTLLKARGEGELIPTVEQAYGHILHAYAELMDVFGEEVARHHMDAAGHVHDDHEHGSERTFTEEADHAAGLARRFMTR